MPASPTDPPPLAGGSAAADWAESGAMALTGPPEGPPALAPGAPASALAGALADFERLTRMRTGAVTPGPAGNRPAGGAGRPGRPLPARAPFRRRRLPRAARGRRLAGPVPRPPRRHHPPPRPHRRRPPRHRPSPRIHPTLCRRRSGPRLARGDPDGDAWRALSAWLAGPRARPGSRAGPAARPARGPDPARPGPRPAAAGPVLTRRPARAVAPRRTAGRRPDLAVGGPAVRPPARPGRRARGEGGEPRPAGRRPGRYPRVLRPAARRPPVGGAGLRLAR